MVSKWCLWEPKVEQKLTKVEAKARYGNTPQKKHPKSGFGAILGSILGAKMLPK